MNKKKYLIITLIIAAILTSGIFGYKYFSNGSAKKIEIQSEVVENNNSAGEINTGNSEVIPEEVKNNPGGVEAPETSNQKGTEVSTEKITVTDKMNISNKFVGWGFEKTSGRKIDTIIIHSTYNAQGGDQFGLSKILDIYKSYGVAPHYIIDRGGKIYRLVEDKNIAYHAGESKVPDGRNGVNNFSIGIELINTKENEFTHEQYEALNKLLKDIKSHYTIKYVLGHNQIAPGRKDDPWNINWNKVNK